MNKIKRRVYTLIIVSELVINVALFVFSVVYDREGCFNIVKVVVYFDCAINVILAGMVSLLWALFRTIKIWGAWYRINFIIFIVIAISFAPKVSDYCAIEDPISIGLLSYCILKMGGVATTVYIDTRVDPMEHVELQDTGLREVNTESEDGK